MNAYLFFVQKIFFSKEEGSESKATLLNEIKIIMYVMHDKFIE